MHPSRWRLKMPPECTQPNRPCAAPPARPRPLTPTERRKRLQRWADDVARELSACLAAARARLLRGIHFRQVGDRIIAGPVLADDPEALALALREAGFEVTVEGMLVVAERPANRRWR